MQKKLANLCRLVLSDKNTRNLFFFLLLNLFFAFVELTYGLWTNSLGLISDSFHMFFDCSALLLGLAASIVTKWKPSDKFTFGFGRAEILAGLANGLFLLFIALFIMKEALERLFEPPEVHHERLFAVSVMGFLVNLVGIFVFQHGGQGGCSHSGHSHKHHEHTEHHHEHDHHHYDQHHNHVHNHNHQETHSHPHHHHHNHDHSVHNHNNNNNNISNHRGHYEPPTIVHTQHGPTAVALDMNGFGQQVNHHKQHPDMEPLVRTGIQLVDGDQNRKPRPNRGHIMQSVFLHIVADTLGSVGVMISALLMNQFGWLIADPLCSMFIALLISVSVYPLLRDSFYVLMQRIPVELDDQLPNCLRRVQALPGVLSVHDAHVWTLNSDTYVGSLKLEVSADANSRQVIASARALLNQLGVYQLHIQLDQVA